MAIDQGMCLCIGTRPARAEASGYGRCFESSGVFFNAGKPFQHEESIGRDTQARMMMKASPIAPFVMPEPQFLFELAVVALDAPTHFDGGHEILERELRREGGEPIMGRLGLMFGPFDEQPFLCPGAVPLRGTYPDTRKARAQGGVSAFAT